jgi:protein ImuA
VEAFPRQLSPQQSLPLSWPPQPARPPQRATARDVDTVGLVCPAGDADPIEAVSAAVPCPAPAGNPQPLEDLHPALWLAHQLGRQRAPVCASGFAELDAELPGGGWPHRTLTELLLSHPGVGELRLLAPALAAVQRSGRALLLFDPPASPCAWACRALGLDLQQLLLVRSSQPRRGRANNDLLWTLEQTLASGHAGAVLAWLPATLGGEAMRRLQLAAQAHDGPAFVLRDLAARSKPSVAALRLLLAPAVPDGLSVSLLKRRGPPLTRTLTLALLPALPRTARQRALHAAARATAGAPAA